MNTKTPIRRFFEARLPEYVFDTESRPNLLFRRRLPEGLYESIAIQRDSQSNAFAPELAVTYNPQWRGEPALPLGISRDIPQLRRNEQSVDAIEGWYFYRPDLEGLTATLEEFLADFELLALPFFEWARKQLLGSKLLQTALRAADDIPAESRAGLDESLKAARYLAWNCTHPAFMALRERIRSEWKNVPKEERRCTNRLAYDVLSYL